MAEDKDLNAFKESQEETVIDTSKKLRIGFIGCGWIAGSHIKSLLKQPDVEIVAGADLVPGKAKAFFEKYGVEGVKTDYASHKELLADKSLNLDAVTICTYNRQHAQPAIDALNAGLHVLLEKPFTVTTEEAVEVMRAEKKSGKILSIGFQPRLDENMIMVKDIVQSGVLGQIYYVQTGGGRRRGIPTPFGTTFIENETAGLGALADIGCYSLDMVLNALGYPKPLTVSGYKSNFFGTDPDYIGYKKCGHPEYYKKFGVDDFAAAFIRLEGGIIVSFRIAWAMNLDTSGDTIIYGTKGSLRIPSTECWNGTIGGDLTIYHEVAGKQVETKIPQIIPKTGAPSNFDKKIRSFCDAVKNGGTAPVPSSQILYNQAILDHIAKSSDLGREVEVVIPEI
ncbi:MAG: Gfo/Idh/MocA family oxidoreductase [Ruminococcaceae bacterium]|nr:Gfo/Idh/MocA family oxidoreductase [Oscillospiraceae bacterium]